jgi:5-methylcytosine-specific restriction enzyme subunit McrC
VRAIPIRNVYYLLLYAWDRFTPKQQIEVGEDSSPDLPHLLARVLVERTRSLLRRGLDRGYEGCVEELASPRGRFLLADSVKRSSSARGRLVCQFDELSADVVHNRILKAALGTFARSDAVEAPLRAELWEIGRKFDAITDVPFTRHLFKKLQLSRNISHYGLLMRICEMVLELMLPEERGQGSRFANILQNEERMSAIFEVFVRNFYKQELKTFTVASEVIAWDTGSDLVSHMNYLPSMLTDVTLRSPTHTIVIDTKFYGETLVSHLGGQKKVRSAHLYQLLSYLTNLANRKGPDEQVEGLLLYPCTDGNELRLEFQLVGHRVRACTIDLTQPWLKIHEEMMAIMAY